MMFARGTNETSNHSSLRHSGSTAAGVHSTLSQTTNSSSHPELSGVPLKLSTEVASVSKVWERSVIDSVALRVYFPRFICQCLLKLKSSCCINSNMTLLWKMKCCMHRNPLKRFEFNLTLLIVIKCQSQAVKDMLTINCFCCSIVMTTMAKRLRRTNNLDDAFMSVYTNIPKNEKLLKLTNLNIKDSTGWSLMHRAVINDDRDTLLFLCNAEMSTGIIANDMTPLQLAIERGNIQALCILLQYGCSEHIINNGCSASYSPLLMALKSRSDSQFDMIKLLLQFGCDVNKADYYLESSRMPTMPLSCAIRCRNYELTELLLDYGAKIIVTLDSEMISFFIDAILVSCKDMVQLFIRKGADVNLPQKSSRVIHRWRLSEMTPLQAALLAHDTSVMKILLQNNADPNLGLKQRALYGFLACHAPICMAAKKPMLKEHFKILLATNCALNWGTEAHRSASTIAHSSPLAFVDNAFAIKLLLIFGCRPSCPEESERFRETVDIHIESGSDFGQWLSQWYYNPASLLHLSCVKIRQCVGLGLRENLHMLALPKKMHTCILMDEYLVSDCD